MDCFTDLQGATARGRARFLATPIVAAGLAGRVSRAQYLAFLTEAYHHVRHTVPLLMACGARLPARLEWLREAVAHYIGEELGHQEWILADIDAAGGDSAAVRRGSPSFATEMMVSYAYDTIQRGNPVGFFGMVYVLESCSASLASQLSATLGASLQLPADAFTYLHSHGSLDIGHMAHFQSLMAQLGDPADAAAVLHAAERFFRLYTEVMAGLPAGDAA
jgi:pyrroloquinoline quinone (PQQ) biosynthesis protein C